MFKFRKKGFTLAEILVAMTIVGVVAALTVPAITSNTQAKSNKLKAKKAFASLATAADAGMAVAGYDFAEITAITGAKPSIEDILSKSLKVRNVTRSANITGNMPLNSAGTCNGTTAYNVEQYCTLTLAGIAATYKLADGSQLMILNTENVAANGCTATTPCIALIDINGEKDPNNTIMCTNESTTGKQAYVWSGTESAPHSVPPATCTVADNAITDIYPVIIMDDRVEPATGAAMTIIEEE